MSNPLIDKETEFEKEMNQYMRVYYDLLGCTYEWDDKKNNFIGDKKKDVTLYYKGKTILIEHKYRDFDRVEYFDVLVETAQDVESSNVGWIYECGAEKLHYIICKTIEGVMQPIYYHRLEFKLFKDWFFCWREVGHPQQKISKRGYGRTINLVVPLNIIPLGVIQKRIIIMTKICTQCKEEKPIDEFYKQPLTRHSMCNKCKRKYNKERYAKQKKLLQESKW